MEQDYDGEPTGKRRKRAAGQGGTGASQGNGGYSNRNTGIKEGYGNVGPMTIRNIFNKGGQIIKHTIKWQKYLDYDFTSNQNMFIIPYQCLAFWTAGWSQPGSGTNNNIKTANGLLAISTGITPLQSTLTVEVFAVTRQRLLQQGTTNTTTYDFETSQNLFVVLADRTSETFRLTAIGDTSPTTLRTNLSETFNNIEDDMTKIAEIPQKNCWEHTWTCPTLDHGGVEREGKRKRERGLFF
jgi:hypothetical protein